ncbi:MAG: PSD1 domain-containing protein [Fuerstia sp.]|nr:PSD1 domain-containing protein [Fuerstiella sp.]
MLRICFLSRTLLNLMLLAAAAAMLDTTAVAADERVEFFESRIRPLLVNRCYECHSAETEQNGGLLLDSKAGWEVGGDSGPAIVPNDPEASLLIKAVRWDNPDVQMPPQDAGGKLTAAEIADLEAWVKSGAFDPRTEIGTAKIRKSWDETFAERRQWWSLQPVAHPPVPEVSDVAWSGSAIDRFLRHRMAAEGITPAGLASAETLIRRATLVLTGLPPQPTDVSAFVEACRQDREAAYAQLVERLLASPQFGERFARHWMDVVRFTETHGNEWNYDVPYAWRYRDYLIRAFNDDVPYNQFVREHIAGDLLATPRYNATGQFTESVIGTAFYRFGEVNHDSCVLFGSIGYDVVDNQLDTLTKAFQATTVACARCHDHKIDAVSTKDYHALLGILRSSRSVQHTLDHAIVNSLTMHDLSMLKTSIRSELSSIWKRDAAALNADKLNALQAAAGDAVPIATDPLFAWSRLTKDAATPGASVTESWQSAASEYAAKSAEHAAFNKAQFTTVADFRDGKKGDWMADGMGLRDSAWLPGDFSVATDGDSAIRHVLSAGVYTFGLSDKLNGAFRSPPLTRTHGKVSFEVMGGGFSLARLVFNNCQLNYTNQHSIHHPDWSWITVDFQEGTQPLHPYAELLTFWDNPKFPDPLGTLSKDTENQRLPFNDHAKNPRTWWGVRRVVAHDGAETPRDEAAFVAPLYEGDPVPSLDQAVERYAAIAANAVVRFESFTSTNDDVRWLEWLLAKGVLSNRADSTPQLAQLIAKYREVEANQITLPRTMPGMADEGPGFDQPVLTRGEYTKPGDVVERRYLEAMSRTTRPDESRDGNDVSHETYVANVYLQSIAPTSAGGSGRALVAEAIVDPDNPLTSRVMANRIWYWIFGNGLVRTPDDFGHVGELPSHPELLDHLATQFVSDQWSMKKLIRSLLLSRAFQSSAAPLTDSREKDPDNLLLSWYPARRAEAEVIRDSILAVSGRLDGTMYGPSIHPYRATADTEKRLYIGPLDGDGRRSIYIKFQLMEAAQFLSAFNLPGGKIAQGRRDASNVPAQSLALLNDPFVLAMADRWSESLVADGSMNVAERLTRMFVSALGRPPSASELQRFEQTINDLSAIHNVSAADILANRSIWKDAAHAVFNFKEFIFIP